MNLFVFVRTRIPFRYFADRDCAPAARHVGVAEKGSSRPGEGVPS